MYKHNIDSIECKALDLIAGFDRIEADYELKMIENDEKQVIKEEKQNRKS